MSRKNVSLPPLKTAKYLWLGILPWAPVGGACLLGGPAGYIYRGGPVSRAAEKRRSVCSASLHMQDHARIYAPSSSAGGVSQKP